MNELCPFCGDFLTAQLRTIYRNPKTVYTIKCTCGLIFYTNIEKTFLTLPTNRRGQNLRRKVHDVVDSLVKKTTYKKREIYLFISKKLGKPLRQTHIALFNARECGETLTFLRDFDKP